MAKQITPEQVKQGDNIAIARKVMSGMVLSRGEVLRVRRNHVEKFEILTIYLDTNQTFEFLVGTPPLQTEIFRLAPDEFFTYTFQRPKTIPVLPNQTTIEEQIAEIIHQ